MLKAKRSSLDWTHEQDNLMTEIQFVTLCSDQDSNASSWDSGSPSLEAKKKKYRLRGRSSETAKAHRG
eukprot:TRINITY_DN1488_c0_g1_i1.p1 TRINITY_DN1488_c0_g1~~TRINITY_DN1488_c0_g1_i1.p1  ORF type:complete len:77 (+),score=40.71 TRINITY_DN1488_c0_g1_i1:29-232(+)